MAAKPRSYKAALMTFLEDYPLRPGLLAIDTERTGDGYPDSPHDLTFAIGFAHSHKDEMPIDRSQVHTYKIVLRFIKLEGESWSAFWHRAGFSQHTWNEFWVKHVKVLDALYEYSERDNNTDLFTFATRLSDYLRLVEQKYSELTFISDAADTDRYAINTLLRMVNQPLLCYDRWTGRKYSNGIHTKSLSQGIFLMHPKHHTCHRTWFKEEIEPFMPVKYEITHDPEDDAAYILMTYWALMLFVDLYRHAAPAPV